MKIGKRAIRQRVRQFEVDLDRAIALFDTLVQSGRAVTNAGAIRPLSQPDRRDAAQFIFFEVAAKFESFMQDLFIIAVRKKYAVSPGRAEYVMGHPERGLSNVPGWGSVDVVQKRARNLFGKTGFLSQLKSRVGEPTFTRLGLAHTLRNRVAHDTADARAKYRRALANLGVPRRSRQGAGVGRVMIEYPLGAALGERWFHRIVRGYRRVATQARSHL